MTRAKRILLSGALAAGRRIPGLAPDVLLAEYGDGSAIYQVRFRVPDFGRETACRDDVASWVLNALHCAGQTIQRSGPDGPAPMPWNSPREALLLHIDLFHAFDAGERADLAAKLRPRELVADQVVVRQGDPGDFLYVLAEGLLDVELVRDGMAPITDRLAPGEVFGEVSLLTGQPRSATVTAAFDSLVFEIHRENLNPILRRRPQIAEGLATVMAERQALNERNGRQPETAKASDRDDLLVRLRQLFGL